MNYKINIYTLNSIYSLTDPVFIASDQSLLSYIVEEKTQYIESPLIKMCNELNCTFLIVSTKLSIINFTKNIGILFNYREEQLIGQQLNILIPNIKKNIRFYEYLDLVLKDKAEPRFTQLIYGQTSDLEIINFEIDVNKIEYQNILFILIQFKSIQEQLKYEDSVQIHEQIFLEMLASSIPNFLLDGSFLKEKTIHHYERFALVYVCYELNDNFHVNIDVKEFKNGIIISSSYYNGKNGSIVIDDTSNSCLIMFVDLSNGSNDDYLNYAFQFFEDYKVEIENENVISSKSGFLIDQIDVDIIYTPPPEIAYDDLCSDNANRPNLIPSPLYEVYTQVLANLKYYLMNLRKNEVLTDAKFMRFFQEEENEVMLESVEEIEGEEENMWYFPIMMNKDNVDVNV